MKVFTLEAKDGKLISVTCWDDVAQPVGVIQVAHGMAEHTGRYDAFARDMNGRGFIVIGDDHRAHGKTDEATLGYCAGSIWEDTLTDMAMVTDYAKQEYGLPIILFGHSYGSFLSQAYIRRWRDKLSGAVIGGSNYFAGPIIGVGKLVARLSMAFKGGDKPNKFLKKASFDAYNNKFEYGTFISSVMEECDAYKKDKLCGYVCSNNFYYNFFSGAKKLYNADGVSLKDFPILLIAGAEDPVGDFGKGVKKLEKWYKEEQGALVKSVIYSEVRHEYLNDISREQARDEIAGFASSLL